MTVWKGRFQKPMDPEALKFSASLDVDGRLYRQDIEGSLAHAAMLRRAGILRSSEAAAIARGLRNILRDLDAGKLNLATVSKGRLVAEDVHMALEALLIKRIGRVGGKLHTARSRNDQVALDERLYLRTAEKAIVGQVRSLQRSLVRTAERYHGVLMPGYTHLQRAQPILLAHHLLAYVAMLERDRERFEDGLSRSLVSPLGAAALAGTSFPVNRNAVARLLKLKGIVENSIDAVSDRDALIEFVSACSITMMHLSRLAEELVLWSSEEWGFVAIGEEFTTGSSIMPQKRNPDVAELVRGKTGRVYGDLIALLTLMKGLPLSYNRDMQEDKESLFDAATTTERSLRIMARMLATVRVNSARFKGELRGGFLLATELADYLVRKGVPFREAHAAVGSVVGECERRGISLADLPLSEYRKRSRAFGADLYRFLDPAVSVAMKRSAGSTAPRQVAAAIRRWKKRL
jgi:argininosuccinate lyase